MDKWSTNRAKQLHEGLSTFLRKCIYSVLRIGPIPRHIAFIMDGNRRYAKKQNLEEAAGHRVGFLALMNVLGYCYELEVKYVTIYAFSIDNFRRRPKEVQSTMQLIQEKIDDLIKEESIVNQYGVRVYFIGNLDLLSEPVKLSAARAMKATAHNSKAVLSICLAYTSTDEIVHAVQRTCDEKHEELRILDTNNAGTVSDSTENATIQQRPLVDVLAVEKHIYMAFAPDPDMIVRTSGETRLSNFLLWQSGSSLLYCPKPLWPEFGFWHFFRSILEFQRNFAYLEKKRKQS